MANSLLRKFAKISLDPSHLDKKPYLNWSLVYAKQLWSLLAFRTPLSFSAIQKIPFPVLFLKNPPYLHMYADKDGMKIREGKRVGSKGRWGGGWWRTWCYQCQGLKFKSGRYPLSLWRESKRAETVFFKHTSNVYLTLTLSCLAGSGSPRRTYFHIQTFVKAPLRAPS